MPSINGTTQYRRERRIVLYDRQEGRCWWCGDRMVIGQKYTASPCYATFEHLKSRAQGGKSNFANVVLAHKRCNEARGVADHGRTPAAISCKRVDDESVQKSPGWA